MVDISSDYIHICSIFCRILIKKNSKTRLSGGLAILQVNEEVERALAKLGHVDCKVKEWLRSFGIFDQKVMVLMRNLKMELYIYIMKTVLKTCILSCIGCALLWVSFQAHSYYWDSCIDSLAAGKV
ncbi:uncharacterized protein LOC130732492 [Lotus japonicus]|uniref:uncharacterized protein LOC130732492 n=1 Tax=Lotus japonicus TaxID=34305 RepID=UPI002589D0F1|nr:uncharacterized protein LOC130732492 [Lotus japonicus]